MKHACVYVHNMYVTAVIVHIQRNKAHRDDARNYSFTYTYIHTYVQVPRICLSNRGTPRRRAEKLCHFHIFRPALTSPVSREIHLRSNLNFKPVKFYIAAGSRPPVFAAGTGNEGGGGGRLGGVCMYASIRGEER